MRNKAAIEERLGEPIEACDRVRGGDINETYRLRLKSGRYAFVKTHPNPPAGMYVAEAQGLDALRSATRDAGSTLRVPAVLTVDEAWLILEDLSVPRSDGPNRTTNFESQLGRGLGMLHLALADGAAPFPGLDHPNFIGSLPQDNTRMPTWAAFYEHKRLRPLVARAKLKAPLVAGFELLFQRLPELLEGAEMSLLHGDLWGGNVYADAEGTPCLIDPAVYVGDREIDLAMMQLFGGFGHAVFEAYDGTFPRRSGHEDRVPLYQLYPLLVHVNLFGESYVAAVRRALAHYV